MRRNNPCREAQAIARGRTIQAAYASRGSSRLLQGSVDECVQPRAMRWPSSGMRLTSRASLFESDGCRPGHPACVRSVCRSKRSARLTSKKCVCEPTWIADRRRSRRGRAGSRVRVDLDVLACEEVFAGITSLLANRVMNVTSWCRRERALDLNLPDISAPFHDVADGSGFARQGSSTATPAPVHESLEDFRRNHRDGLRMVQRQAALLASPCHVARGEDEELSISRSVSRTCRF